MTGLGKTTLAHVVARHCGYRPVEINASDDRSAAALSQRVMHSAQMRTVTGDTRPACIIIDEIDGAVGASALCTALRGRKNSSRNQRMHTAARNTRAGPVLWPSSQALNNRLILRLLGCNCGPEPGVNAEVYSAVCWRVLRAPIGCKRVAEQVCLCRRWY